MLDLRQSNEPVYYVDDHLQITSGNELRSVEERHDELRHLEGDIVQLHEIHRDFAQLVNGQNDIIDNIESSVAKTEDQVITGAQTLVKAVGLQSAARRKKILCGLLLFIIITIAIIVTVVIVVSKKS